MRSGLYEHLFIHTLSLSPCYLGARGSMHNVHSPDALWLMHRTASTRWNFIQRSPVFVANSNNSRDGRQFGDAANLRRWLPLLGQFVFITSISARGSQVQYAVYATRRMLLDPFRLEFASDVIIFVNLSTVR